MKTGEYKISVENSHLTIIILVVVVWLLLFWCNAVNWKSALIILPFLYMLMNDIIRNGSKLLIVNSRFLKNVTGDDLNKNEVLPTIETDSNNLISEEVVLITDNDFLKLSYFIFGCISVSGCPHVKLIINENENRYELMDRNDKIAEIYRHHETYRIMIYLDKKHSVLFETSGVDDFTIICDVFCDIMKKRQH